MPPCGYCSPRPTASKDDGCEPDYRQWNAEQWCDWDEEGRGPEPPPSQIPRPRQNRLDPPRNRGVAANEYDQCVTEVAPPWPRPTPGIGQRKLRPSANAEDDRKCDSRNSFKALQLVTHLAKSSHAWGCVQCPQRVGSRRSPWGGNLPFDLTLSTHVTASTRRIQPASRGVVIHRD